ncbi:MAG TPA: amino acid adenylation domain-containing protein, partial [Vicinamibacteria bacterium]
MSQGQPVADAAARRRALLARMIKERGIEAPAQEVAPRPDPADRPLSFAQQRMWFLDQLEPGSPRYNVFTAVRLQGALERDALARSLAEVERRHEVLRVSYVEVDGQPEQRVAPAGPFPLAQVDLAHLPERERLDEVRRLALAEARTPFRLDERVFRAILVRLSEEDHALLLSLHHIAADGWSMSVLTDELWTLYESARAGEPFPLPEPPLQYADYAAWQREWLRGPVLDAQLAYWRRQLQGVAALDLPTDRPRPAVQGFEGGWRVRPLPAGLVERVRAWSREAGVTTYITLLSAFAALLRRYTGQDDVAIGSPIANRTRAELERLVGLFANTLVMRTDLSGDPSFRDLVARVRDVAHGAYAHQDLPFEKLVEDLNPERHLSRSPLFQVSFILRDIPRPARRLADLTVSPAGVENLVSKFDLTLYVTDAEPGWLAFEYSAELFETATIDRMAGHFETLLGDALGRPDRRVSELRLLTEPEAHQVLTAWNATARDYGRPRCVHALFEAQVERTPDAPALACEGETLSYRELDARANRLAHRLVSLGVGPDVRVGICMERSAEMVVGLLAILKAGGAYVPLDPGYPRERLAFMLEDSAVGVLLTQERLAAALPAHRAAVVAVDAEAAALAVLPAHAPASGVTPAHLAYVIYTSGSTGRPKGAMNQHGAVCNRLLWMQETYGLGTDDRVLQKTPFSFDVSVWEFFWPLLAGARLVVARPEGHRDAAYLARLMAAERITTVHFVPSMLRLFLEEEEAREARSLRRVICSGEALPYDLQQRFFEVLPAELHNLYGPTEAAVDVTWWPCRRDDARHLVPIGRPIANTQAYVLDTSLRPVPEGAVGELYLGGVQVGRGYLNRPELTAERFVPDAYGGVAGARLYRTGDLARWLPDGSLEYLGRVDFQVKVRGFRIELGEIESALLRHPEVKDAVVVAREDRPGDQRLVAYVVGAAAPERLRGDLLERLPEYMVPSAFVSLPALPLSPNGKVDRRALPAPGETAPGRRGGVLRTPAEEALAAIWADVLGRGPVGPEDNFFELGGHSLLATRVVSQARRTFEVEIPLRALFEAPTVRGLAERVALARRAGRRAAPPLQKAAGAGDRPLSFAQERMWFLHQLDPGPAYNLRLGLRLQGGLDVPALARSVRDLAGRHEALRTRFVAAGGRAAQVVDEEPSLTLELEDLGGEPAATREEALQRRAAEESARPFDLAQAAPVRARLFRLSGHDHALLLTLHHIVADGWSLAVLTRELGELYRAHRAGGEAPLPALPVQPADHAAWQREWLAGDVLEGQLAFWRAQLADVPVLRLPTDRPRPSEPCAEGASERLELPAGLRQRLEALGRAEGATLLLDIDGAGHGWFVDLSPEDSSEFRARLAEGVVAATPGSTAYGRMDLLTVVTHELGHVMGFDHMTAGGLPVMVEELQAGMRYLVAPREAAAARPAVPVVPQRDLMAD